MVHKIISIVFFAAAMALFTIGYFIEFQASPYWLILAVILLAASVFAEHFSQENGEDFEHLEERPDWFKHMQKWVCEPALAICFISLLASSEGLTDDPFPWWGKTALFALVFVGGLNVFFQLKAIRRERYS